MADTFTHTLMGTALAKVVPERFTTTRIVVASLGAVSGAWPDVGGWLDSALYGTPRWWMYNQLHQNPPWYWHYQPPFLLHIELDKLFHAPTGGWTTLGWILELPCLLIGIGLFLWTFPVILQWIVLKIGGK